MNTMRNVNRVIYQTDLVRELANGIVVRGHYTRLYSSNSEGAAPVRIELFASHTDDSRLWGDTIFYRDCEDPQRALLMEMDSVVGQIQSCCIDQVPVVTRNKGKGLMLIRALFEGLTRLRRLKRQAA